MENFNLSKFGLDEKKTEFINLYLKTGNAKQSFLTVYKGKETSASAGGFQLLQQTSVKKALQYCHDEINGLNLVEFADIINNLKNVERLARDAKKYSDCIEANKLLANLMGFAPSANQKPGDVNNSYTINILPPPVQQLTVGAEVINIAPNVEDIVDNNTIDNVTNHINNTYNYNEPEVKPIDSGAPIVISAPNGTDTLI